MDQHLKINEAKELLKSAGYYTDNLWSVEDVMNNFSCTEEQAQKVLDKALSLESVMDEIWFAIGFISADMNLQKIEECII
jgi:hypothetical protein